jgi:hypothetical protein
MAVLVFRGGRWRCGGGGWGGFIPHGGPGQGLWHVGGVEVDAGLAGGSGDRCVSSRATTSTGTPRRISPVVICLACEPVRAPWPPVWFLAGPVGQLSADRWQSASCRVPAVPRGTDAGHRSAARSPRSAFVPPGRRSQPDLLDERMSVRCTGGGVPTGSEPGAENTPLRNRQPTGHARATYDDNDRLVPVTYGKTLGWCRACKSRAAVLLCATPHLQGLWPLGRQGEPQDDCCMAIGRKLAGLAGLTNRRRLRVRPAPSDGSLGGRRRGGGGHLPRA